MELDKLCAASMNRIFFQHLAYFRVRTPKRIQLQTLLNFKNIISSEVYKKQYRNAMIQIKNEKRRKNKLRQNFFRKMLVQNVLRKTLR
jgi:hypothetical protein